MSQGSGPEADLIGVLSKKVVGQSSAIKSIVPYIEMHRAQLSPEGRPAGIFLLLGPTGTGKTRTVEALAEILHGSEKSVLKIDCGEYQMEHEVAKLIGAPPGYTGHRETVPVLNQNALSSVTSQGCKLSLVLFDEIEKAAPSLTRLLLGILDKAQLKLSDGNTVDFTDSLIFFTSNLGAREMLRESQPDFGFEAGAERLRNDLPGKLEAIALAAVRRRFSPEFVNRIDAVITFMPLESESLTAILEQHITKLQHHVNTRLGDRCFTIDVSPASRQFLLDKGTSVEYGARELKRTIHRNLTQPLATLVAAGRIEPGSRVLIELAADGSGLEIHTGSPQISQLTSNSRLLVVDDNHDLVTFLGTQLKAEGWIVITAETATEAMEIVQNQPPMAMVVDYMLPDENGVELAAGIHKRLPETKVIVMSGAQLAEEDVAICDECHFGRLTKPFHLRELVNLLREFTQPEPGAAKAGSASR
ncbi:MAG TPA: AAA family ATPase [Terriglobales bacterium]|nr:AAA family ATPase [Terriglobales bacterium]